MSRPYMEGRSLFKFSDSASDLAGLPATYTLVVPAKPTSTPPECSHFPQPNTPNSVIAYATSTNVRSHAFKSEGVVSAVQDNNRLLLASRASVGPWEQFDVLTLDGAAISPTSPGQILRDLNIRCNPCVV